MNPMMMMQQPPTPKGDIAKLWNLLGVDFSADQIVWQNYNPYPRMGWFGREPEFVFVDSEAEVGDISNKVPITSRLKQLLFVYPGSIREKNMSTLTFTPLVTTGKVTGTVPCSDLRPGMRGEMSPVRRHDPKNRPFVLAAEIEGKVDRDKQSDGGNAETDKTAKKADAQCVRVVLVADLDMLTQPFFEVRAMGETEAGIHFNFDNITFVLNTVDRLAGDDRFIELRKRRPVHRTLKAIEQWTKEARENAEELQDQYVKQFEETKKKLEEDFEKEMAPLQGADLMTQLQEVVPKRLALERRKAVELSRLQEERDRDIEKLATDLKETLKGVQNQVKYWTMLVPPAPLFALAIVVWAVRRRGESEGVARSRMR